MLTGISCGGTTAVIAVLNRGDLKHKIASSMDPPQGRCLPLLRLLPLKKAPRRTMMKRKEASDWDLAVSHVSYSRILRRSPTVVFRCGGVNVQPIIGKPTFSGTLRIRKDNWGDEFILGSIWNLRIAGHRSRQPRFSSESFSIKYLFFSVAIVVGT